MDPKTIRANLARQEAIVRRGLKKKAEAYIEAGFPANVIAKAYGLDPARDLGIGGKEDKATDAPVRDFDDAAAIPEGAKVRDNQTGRLMIKRNGKLEPVE